MSVITQKLGPFPVWVWGIVVAGGYLGYRFLVGGSSGIGSGTVIGTGGDATGGGGGGGDSGSIPTPPPVPAAPTGIGAAIAAAPAAASGAVGGFSSAVSSGGTLIQDLPQPNQFQPVGVSSPNIAAPANTMAAKPSKTISQVPQSAFSIAAPSTSVPGYSGATKLYPGQVIKQGSPVIVGGGKTSSGTYVEPHVIALGGGTNPFATEPKTPTIYQTASGQYQELQGPPVATGATGASKPKATGASKPKAPATSTGTYDTGSERVGVASSQPKPTTSKPKPTSSTSSTVVKRPPNVGALEY